ncbi:tetratricopeptide repeat protein [Brevundimonas balnearis]|uniref:Tetratricopeptide repeat protein n=1 Tax=Brevundimonas balnearis TaxID=1572858 RepID=A0ABV6R3L7_9CAUL
MTALPVQPQPSPAPDASQLVLGVQARAEGLFGDAASAQALGRLSRALADGGGRAKADDRKLREKLKAALARVRQGDFAGGARSALEALKTDERSFLAWHILAICQEKSGQFGPAILAYEAALKLAPQDTDIAHDLARLAERMGEAEIAEKLLTRYLAAHPGHVEATNNLACVYRDQRRYGEAVDLLKALLGIEQTSAVLWNTLGTVLSDQGEARQAMVFFEEALRLEPRFVKARYNRGNARQILGDRDGALEDLTQALKGAEPGYERAMMTMARGMQLMAAGRLAEGYADYEARLDPAMPDAPRFATPVPRWRPDEPLEGRRLLVTGEQGLADEMLFGSLLPDLVEALGPTGRLFVAVESRLVPMFQRALPTAIVGGHRSVKHQGRLHRLFPFLDQLDGEGPDCWAPMGSLMTALRPTIDRFPARPGYLPADPVRVARWRDELSALGPGLKVGLHWKSLVMKGARVRYFSSFERWRPVLTTPGCRMINLQCGDVADDLAEAQAAGVDIWTPPINLKDDLEDVAALSVAVDLVVGPGVAGTNLAAATGARTWMIHAPDDWHRLGTEGYPFYPGMRFIPLEGFDGWPVALAKVREDLEAAAARGGFD